MIRPFNTTREFSYVIINTSAASLAHGFNRGNEIYNCIQMVLTIFNGEFAL